MKTITLSLEGNVNHKTHQLCRVLARKDKREIIRRLSELLWSEIRAIELFFVLQLI
jgi:hypothetical protein